MNRTQFNRYISDADFRTLFNELGWDNAPKQFDTTIAVEEEDYEMKAISQQRGFIIYTCEVDTIPQNTVCRKVDIRLRRYSNDYILIFIQKGSEHHLWMAPVKTVEKRDLVTIEYVDARQDDFLFIKIDSSSFDLVEEPTYVDIIACVLFAVQINSG